MAGCIEWTKSYGSTGYGQQRYEGTVHKAHRVAWAKANGKTMAEIKGVFIRHKCDNPGCVNPDHLEPGTVQDNQRDMVERRRSAKHEAHSQAKITKQQADEIRRLYVPRHREFSGRALARRFGLAHATVQDVLNNRTWRAE